MSLFDSIRHVASSGAMQSAARSPTEAAVKHGVARGAADYRTPRASTHPKHRVFVKKYRFADLSNHEIARYRYMTRAVQDEVPRLQAKDERIDWAAIALGPPGPRGWCL